MKDRGWLVALLAGLAFLALVLAASLEARSRQSMSNVQATQAALKEFAEALTRDGQINGQQRTVTIAGAPVTLRAVPRLASALENPPRGRNVIELWNLPCGIAQALDARADDGNLARGNVRASISACPPGGENDPVRVVAVAASL